MTTYVDALNRNVRLETTTSSASTSQQCNTNFFSLPFEIRLEVYTYLLCLAPDSSSRQQSHRHLQLLYHDYHASQSRIHPNILLANRQINYEATYLLYSTNIFIAHPNLLASFPRLRPWYGPLRETAVLPRIRRFHLRLRLDCDLAYDRVAAAKAFSGVDELSIHVAQSEFLGVGCDNLAVLEDVRGVGKVTISGSTTGFEDYILWLQNAMQSAPGCDIPKLEALGSAMAALTNHFNTHVLHQQQFIAAQ